MDRKFYFRVTRDDAPTLCLKLKIKIAMLGMSTAEIQKYLADKGIPRGKRIIQLWQETGEWIETDLTIKAIDEITRLWDLIYDENLRMEQLSVALPQHVIDRRELLAFARMNSFYGELPDYDGARKAKLFEFDRQTKHTSKFANYLI